MSTDLQDSMALRGDLDTIQQDMRAIVKTAEKQNRDFTALETAQFDGLKAKSELLEHRIEAAEREETAADQYGSDAEMQADDEAFFHRKKGTEKPTSILDHKGRMTRGLQTGESISKMNGVHSSAGCISGMSFGDFCRAIVTGPRNDAERRVMNEGTDSAGGYAVPTVLAAQLLDKARARSRVVQAGANTVILDSDNLRYAKITADPAVAWRAENAAVAINDATLGAVDFVPESCAVMVKASFELAEDAPNFGALIDNVSAGTMGAEMDRVALVGSGASNEPLGLMGMTSVNEVDMGTNGLAISSYDPIINAVQLVRDANHEPGNSMIMAPRTAAELAKLVDADSNPLTVPGDIPMRRLHTTNVPVDQTQGTSSDASTIFLGDWSQLVFGIRHGVRVEVNRSLYAANMQVGFLIYMRLDVQAFYEAALARIVGIIP